MALGFVRVTSEHMFIRFKFSLFDSILSKRRHSAPCSTSITLLGHNNQHPCASVAPLLIDHHAGAATIDIGLAKGVKIYNARGCRVHNNESMETVNSS